MAAGASSTPDNRWGGVIPSSTFSPRQPPPCLNGSRLLTMNALWDVWTGERPHSMMHPLKCSAAKLARGGWMHTAAR